MMGLQFDNSGVYMGWSNLFDYTSLQTIEASELLPMPQKIEYQIASDGVDLLALDQETYPGSEEAQAAIQTIVQCDDIIGQQTSTLSTVAEEKMGEVLRNIEQAKINRLKAYATLLNFCQKYDIYKISDTSINKDLHEHLKDDIIPVMRTHEFTKIAPNNLEAVAKNFISSHIQNTVQHLTNSIGSYSPIEMEVLRDATQYSSIVQNQRIMSLLNPATKYLMQNINKVGKDVIGIAATGIKGSFTWHYYLNELYQNKQKYRDLIERSKFSFTTYRIYGRYLAGDDINSDSYDGKKELRSLPDVDWDSVPDSVKAVLFGEKDINDPEYHAKLMADLEKFIIKNNITVSLMESQVLSAATDNAKELILKQINSGSDMAKCYLYLITLGFDVRDIVSFMTSDVAMFVAKMTTSDIYNNTNLSINKSLKILQGDGLDIKWAKSFFSYKSKKKITKNTSLPIINKYLYEDTEINVDTLTKELLGDSVLPEDQRAVVDLANELKRIKRILPDTQNEYNKADLKDFMLVLKGADEFSNFSRLLGINQGIKTKEADYYKYLKAIANIIKNRENDLGLVKNKKVDAEVIKTLGLERFTDIIGKFDVNRWLESKDYQEKVAEYYSNIKIAIPIFDIINNIPQFNASFQLLDVVNTFNHEGAVRSKIMTKLYENYDTEYWPDSTLSKISRIAYAKLIESFIYSQNINLPIAKGTMLIDNNINEIPVANNDTLKLNTVQRLASFKYIFENKIIPNLQQGILYTIDKDGKVIENKDKDIRKKLKANKFIQGLVSGDDNDRSIARLNVDMLNYENTPEGRQKMEWYLQGIEELQGIKMGDLSVADWFILYNLYTNHNQYGSNRMTTVFKHFIDRGSDSPTLNEFLKYIGDIDYFSKITFNPHNSLDSLDLGATITITPTKPNTFSEITISIQDLLMTSAPTVYSTTGRRDPICKVREDNGIKYYQKKEGYYAPLVNRYFTGDTEEESQRIQYIINNYFTLGGLLNASITTLIENLKNTQNSYLQKQALLQLMQSNFITISQPICQ